MSHQQLRRCVSLRALSDPESQPRQPAGATVPGTAVQLRALQPSLLPLPPHDAPLPPSTVAESAEHGVPEPPSQQLQEMQLQSEPEGQACRLTVTIVHVADYHVCSPHHMGQCRFDVVCRRLADLYYLQVQVAASCARLPAPRLPHSLPSALPLNLCRADPLQRQRRFATSACTRQRTC